MAEKYRLSDEEVEFARRQRLKQVEMWATIREFMLYVIIFTLISVMVHYGREEKAFYQVHHMRNYFLNTRQYGLNYRQVSS